MELLEVQKDPFSDYNLSFKEIVEKNGFYFESHEVETEDGYLLTVYRVRAPTT